MLRSLRNHIGLGDLGSNLPESQFLHLKNGERMLALPTPGVMLKSGLRGRSGSLIDWGQFAVVQKALRQGTEHFRTPGTNGSE